MLYNLKLILLLIIGIFFLIVGILLLVSSYQLNNPYAFIITLFASNLMILISATLVLGFALRLFKGHGSHSHKSKDQSDNDNNN